MIEFLSWSLLTDVIKYVVIVAVIIVFAKIIYNLIRN